MQEIVLAMVLDRWPQTLHSALATLEPFVDRKVALIDPRSGLASLDNKQRGYFDIVSQARSQGLAGLRNESLALAHQIATPNSWALVLDADEHIDPPSLIAAREAVASASGTSAFLLPQYNYVGHGRWTTAYGFRLFSLDSPIEYRHDIHESISFALTRHKLSWRYAPAPIQHLDFLDPVIGKRLRYRRLLAEAIEIGDDLTFLKTLYAMECSWQGEYERAFALLDEAIELAADPVQNRRFAGRSDFPLALKAQYLFHQNDLDQAGILFGQLVEKAEARVTAEAALALSNIASLEGRQLDALRWIDKSLERWPLSEAAFSRAVVLAELGETEKAFEAISLGLRLNPMAGDHRILIKTNPESIYVRQSLLNPAYHGLPALIQMIG